MATRLLSTDPQAALAHASAARSRGSRVGVVREAAGVAAYAAGDYSQALSELRTARRLTGQDDYLPMMADCERGLGRPERALDIAASDDAKRLDKAGQIEMTIVAAGARRDMGDAQAAVVELQIPELRARVRADWVPRLRYAYADALEAVGRKEEALAWFLRALDADSDEQTDAADRVARLSGTAESEEGLDDEDLAFLDLADEDDEHALTAPVQARDDEDDSDLDDDEASDDHAELDETGDDEDSELDSDEDSALDEDDEVADSELDADDDAESEDDELLPAEEDEDDSDVDADEADVPEPDAAAESQSAADAEDAEAEAAEPVAASDVQVTESAVAIAQTPVSDEVEAAGPAEDRAGA
jgi:hypothetical protein